MCEPRSSRILEARAFCWLLIVVACTLALIVRWRDGAPLDPNFLSILPEPSRDTVEAEAIERLTGFAEGRIVWLLHADSSDATVRAAGLLADQLRATGLFAHIGGVPDDAMPDVQRFAELFPFRWQLLPGGVKDEIEASPADFVKRARDELFGPFAATRLRQLSTDPLSLFERELALLIPSRIELYQGVATVMQGDDRWAVLSGELEGHAFDLAALHEVSRLVDRSRRLARDGHVELLVTGLPLFAAEGAARAKREISLIGTGSVLGILVLLIATFGSVRPVLLALVTSSTGLLVATTVTAWLFPNLHLLTLVFGATLIGLSVDYALHFLTDALRGPTWRPEDGMRRTFFGIGLGLLVPLVAYVSLAFAPFPVLRQISVYSAAGLFGAWMTAVLLLPAVARAARTVRRPAAMRLAAWYSVRFPQLSDRRVAIGLAVIVVALGMLVTRVSVQDDVRRFQSPSIELRVDAERIADILEQQRDTQFLLVRGDNEARLLAHERRLSGELDRLIRDGRLRSYNAISRSYPDCAEQQRNYQFIKGALYDPGLMDGFFESLQATDAIRAAHLRELEDADNRTIDVDTWTAVVGAPFEDMWLGCTPVRGCASIVTLDGFAKLTAGDRSALQLDGVTLVDRVGQISAEMSRYRVVASQLVAAAYLAATLLLCVRFKPLGCIRIAAVPLFAVLIALAVVHLTGLTVSLFTTFALVLVVGFAFDYAVFYRLHGAASEITALAVLLSAATTLLGFGLLSLSDTAVLRDFGVVMTTGLLSAFLVAPISSSTTMEHA